MTEKNETYVVVLHFNEEISLQFSDYDQISDEFIDKALQEMKLINLKKNMKSTTLEAPVKPVTVSNTIIARKQKQLEIFDYKPVMKEFTVNQAKKVNDLKANQSVMPMRLQNKNAI